MILSNGFYLDHLLNPIKLYNKPIFLSKINPFGCIACTWTELISEENILTALVPSLYILSVRWLEYPLKNNCEKIG